MTWAEMKNMVGKFIVIRYFVCGSEGSRLGVFKIKNYRDFPATYKVIISPTKPFKEWFTDSDIYSMDLAGMLDKEKNVFDSFPKAKAYYNSIKE